MAIVIVIVIVVLVVIGGLIALMGINRLRQRRVSVDEAFAGIEVQLTRRADLIPNLVETVKGYMTHERETLEAVTNARAAAKAADSVPAAARADAQMQQALANLYAVAERYPDLKASTNFRPAPGRVVPDRGPAGLRPAVLQRLGGDAEPDDGHHSVVDARRLRQGRQGRVLRRAGRPDHAPDRPVLSTVGPSAGRSECARLERNAAQSGGTSPSATIRSSSIRSAGGQSMPGWVMRRSTMPWTHVQIWYER